MAEKKDTYFKTAEQKHKENVVLKCKVCGQKMKGKSTLSRHISHAHDEMDPADREKIVIDTYYGHDVVEKTIRKFKNGEYKNKAIPIDIGKYLRLAEIKPEDEEEDDEKKEKETSFEEDPPTMDYESDKQLIKVKDLADKEYHDKKVDKENFYVEDATFYQEENVLTLSLTKGKTTALDFRLLLKYIEENKAKESMILISSHDEMCPATSIEVKDPDKAAGSQIKCVVAYDSTKSKKE